MPSAVAHDRVAAVEGGLRRQRPDPGADVVEIAACGRRAAPAKRRRRARAQRLRLVALRARAGSGRPAQPLGQAGHQLALAVERGAGRIARARVRSSATARSSSARSGTIRFAASVGVDAARSATRSSNGRSVSWPIALTTGVSAAGHRAHQRLVAERQQVLDAAAAAGDHDDVDVGVGVEAVQRGDDLVHRGRALHRDVLDLGTARPAARRRAFSTTSRSAALARPVIRPMRCGQERQRALALGGEQALGGQQLAQCLEPGEQLTQPDLTDLGRAQAERAALEVEVRPRPQHDPRSLDDAVRQDPARQVTVIEMFASGSRRVRNWVDGRAGGSAGRSGRRSRPRRAARSTRRSHRDDADRNRILRRGLQPGHDSVVVRTVVTRVAARVSNFDGAVCRGALIVFPRACGSAARISSSSCPAIPVHRRFADVVAAARRPPARRRSPTAAARHRSDAGEHLVAARGQPGVALLGAQGHLQRGAHREHRQLDRAIGQSFGLFGGQRQEPDVGTDRAAAAGMRPSLLHPCGVRTIRSMPSTVRRTRRKRVLLAKPRGYCAGVDRAVQTVEHALDHYGAPVYVRKQIVHNLHVVRALEGARRDLRRGERRGARGLRSWCSRRTASRPRSTSRPPRASCARSTRPARW